MPAESAAQQRLFGMALAAKRGKGKFGDKVQELANSMSAKKLREFAKTKHEGLPEKKANMTSLQQAFINGFVKRAAQHGINEIEAVELLKQSSFSDEELTDRKASPILQTLGYGTPLAPISASMALFDEFKKHPDLPSKAHNITLPALLGGVTGMGLAAKFLGQPAYDYAKTINFIPEEYEGLAPVAAILGGGALGSGLGAYLGTGYYNSKLDQMKKKAAPNQIETQRGGKTYKQVARNPEHDVAPAPASGVSAASLNVSKKYRLPIPPGGTTEPAIDKK